ncbi:hypothetical protein GF366_05150 [Candidatus Peregrinibacteria bacterium]|nr:hypothetical protein [Candidatus Peregrinibacteria bacterium]
MQEIETKLWAKTKRYVRFLQAVPFLKMVAVCNNLAFGKVNKKSDIDLFIVAKKNRLFIVRSFVTLFLQILGVRRHHKNIKARFCLSFFIDEENLDLSKIAIKNDIYLAYWIKTMIPIIERNVFKNFLEKNKWAEYYFEDKKEFWNNEYKILKKSKFLNFSRKIFEIILNRKFGDFIEKSLKKWQIKRAKKKIIYAGDKSSIIVSDHILKFHNIDRRREYRRLWYRKHGKDLITDERFSRLFP